MTGTEYLSGISEQNYVRTFDKNGRMLYESPHATADTAYKEYKEILRILKKRRNSERITVTRWRFGKIMVIETVG